MKQRFPILGKLLSEVVTEEDIAVLFPNGLRFQ